MDGDGASADGMILGTGVPLGAGVHHGHGVLPGAGAGAHHGHGVLPGVGVVLTALGGPEETDPLILVPDGLATIDILAEPVHLPILPAITVLPPDHNGVLLVTAELLTVQ